MRQIRFIEVKSEIAAGTRGGASLGIDALKVASLDLGSDFFKDYEADNVDTINEVLFKENDTPNAKYIESVYIMETRVCDKVSEVMEQGEFPLVLAGDHSTAAGTIAGVKKANSDKRLGVIWIDAHADLHSPYTTPSGNMHGMPLAMVAAIDNMECGINEPIDKTVEFWEKIKKIGGEEAKIDIHDIVFVAARDLEEPEKELLRKHNTRNFTTEEVRELGVPHVARQALSLLSECDIIYVSFDVDSMDSSISVGTGTPVPNGLSIEEAKELNTLLISDKKVCAWEMVEVNPTLDTENKMAESALRVLEEVRSALEDRLARQL